MAQPLLNFLSIYLELFRGDFNNIKQRNGLKLFNERCETEKRDIKKLL